VYVDIRARGKGFRGDQVELGALGERLEQQRATLAPEVAADKEDLYGIVELRGAAPGARTEILRGSVP
jgi:hypothetical protein